ncbi:serine hydrolase domain-containing protein [Pseudomonas matsuisoli]|uniref:EstA family serine hydrolase n=1 Tax=Pseudomonas matsuisoli TaxID=1515666 RepID=A0A917PSG8_9PSED|nr:serine hydrolase domain-containing protein [Pseudomonas matsuisoli]GGJ89816.1 EstA family serine hydrolase [Pseudomonas matsuisoli]
MLIQGYFDLRFERVRDSFAALFENPQERGAALCIQVSGETVVDLWAGAMDRDREATWREDTLVNVFSCTKPFAAVALLQAAADGRLDLDAPVSRVWPEFGQAGKEGITARHLLSHTAGMPAIHESLPPEALYDWHRVTVALAGQSSWWTPGAEHGYSPITYGWTIGELLRRIDDMGPGKAVEARVCRPLGLDFHIGLAEGQFERVAHVGRAKGWTGDAAAQRMLNAMMREPNSLSTRSFTNPPGVMTSTNKPEWRGLEQVAASGHGNARSLAGFYAGLLSGALLDSEMLSEMTREHAVGDDRTLLTSTRLGLGCMLDQPGVANATYGLGPRSFGHPGAGGSTGFADPDLDIAFGFVTNTLGPYVLMDPRAQALARALGDCLDVSAA